MIPARAPSLSSGNLCRKNGFGSWSLLSVWKKVVGEAVRKIWLTWGGLEKPNTKSVTKAMIWMELDLDESWESVDEAASSRCGEWRWHHHVRVYVCIHTCAHMCTCKHTCSSLLTPADPVTSSPLLTTFTSAPVIQEIFSKKRWEIFACSLSPSLATPLRRTCT